MVAANPELESGISAVLGITRPCVVVFERVGDNIGDFHGLAKGASGGLGGHVVLLRSPSHRGEIVRLCVEKVVFQQLGEDCIRRVAGRVDRVSALAGGICWTHRRG